MILSSDILFHWHSVVNLLLAIKTLFHIIFYILHHSKMSRVYIFNYCIPLKKNTCFFLYSCHSDIFLFSSDVVFCTESLCSLFFFSFIIFWISSIIGKFFISFSACDIFASLFFLLGSFSELSLFFSLNFFLFFLLVLIC